ncbi:MAG TPA: acyl-CoA dehydrogenase family protein [Acidimicrobiales bacterium]
MIVFEVTEEQEEFRQALRRFFQQKSQLTEVRRMMATDDGYDAAVWKQMAEQLGLQGLLIPERLGGSELTFVELAIVFEEMGSVLACAPFFSTVALAANALLASGGPVAEQHLPGIAAGTTIATVAMTDAERPTLAHRSGDGYSLDGSKRFVVDGCLADLLLVVADLEGESVLFALDAAATGLSRIAEPTLDRTRKLARLNFDAVPATRVTAPGEGAAVLEKTVRLATVALAAEQVGGAQACLDMAVAYAKDRVQFGRAIGSFQAVKHLCADTLLEVESARSAASYAAWAVAEGSEDQQMVAEIAKAAASEAFLLAATNNLQIHGGIGFTWEVDCHLYLRRAKSSEAFFGTPIEHRESVAAKLGL